jgi:hypothetical protein
MAPGKYLLLLDRHVFFTGHHHEYHLYFIWYRPVLPDKTSSLYKAVAYFPAADVYGGRDK